MSFTEILDQLPRLKPEQRNALAELIARMEDTAGNAPRPSLRNLQPASVGAVLRPFPAPDDDLLGEMLATS